MFSIVFWFNYVVLSFILGLVVSYRKFMASGDEKAVLANAVFHMILWPLMLAGMGLFKLLEKPLSGVDTFLVSTFKKIGGKK